MKPYDSACLLIELNFREGMDGGEFLNDGYWQGKVV